MKKRKTLISQNKQAEEKVKELTAALNVNRFETKFNIKKLFYRKRIRP